MASPTRILLGVTGGIAAYKAPDLVRRLRERGAEVQVVLSAGAQHFVQPLTFQAVSHLPVRSDLWDREAEMAMGHLELARWAELVLIAPATADALARLAAGQASDLLSTLCLATEAPLAVAPAMNWRMWQHPATQANVATLTQRGVRVLGPASGALAEGESGLGRMLEPAEIADAVMGSTGAASKALGANADIHDLNGAFDGKRVIVTAGPTREPIDPVRFVTNRSSGKMGFAVAAAAAEAGAKVLLVAGPVHLPTPAGVERIDVETAAQMHAAVMARVQACDLFIGAAAVSDYAPVKPAARKLKKLTAHMELVLERTPDILSAVAAATPKPFCVGFAAETEELERHARGKLRDKQLDLVAANLVGEGRAFDRDDNALSVYWRDGAQELARAPKAALARALIALIAERLLGKSA
jgi:phosphopantothenoylcysteine decarboxylase/phosphopantothenate--cysteine ligase